MKPILTNNTNECNKSSYILIPPPVNILFASEILVNAYFLLHEYQILLFKRNYNHIMAARCFVLRVQAMVHSCHPLHPESWLLCNWDCVLIWFNFHDVAINYASVSKFLHRRLPRVFIWTNNTQGLKLTKKDWLRDVWVFRAGVENEQYLLAASYYNCHGPKKIGMRGSNLFKRVFLGL